MEREFTSVSTDWEGKIYCFITLGWNYEERNLDISMPGYIKKALLKYKHEAPTKPHHPPYRIPPKKYGIGEKYPIPEDEYPEATEEDIKYVQGFVRIILFYARAVDMTFLVTLNTIDTKQASSTHKKVKTMKDLLEYAATNTNARIIYRASDTILKINSNAYYLSEPKARSRQLGIFFLGRKTKNNKPIKLNIAIFTMCTVLKFVSTLAAEA